MFSCKVVRLPHPWLCPSSSSSQPPRQPQPQSAWPHTQPHPSHAAQLLRHSEHPAPAHHVALRLACCKTITDASGTTWPVMDSKAAKLLLLGAVQLVVTSTFLSVGTCSQPILAGQSWDRFSPFFCTLDKPQWQFQNTQAFNRFGQTSCPRCPFLVMQCHPGEQPLTECRLQCCVQKEIIVQPGAWMHIGALVCSS